MSLFQIYDPSSIKISGIYEALKKTISAFALVLIDWLIDRLTSRGQIIIKKLPTYNFQEFASRVDGVFLVRGFIHLFIWQVDEVQAGHPLEP